MSSDLPSPPPAPDAGRGRTIALGVAVLALAAGIWGVAVLLPQWLTRDRSAPPAPPPEPAPVATADTRQIHATLFYVSSNGRELIPVSRDIPYAATPAEQARRIVEAQVRRPPGGRLSAIPEGTTVRNVFVTPRGTAYVDFGPEIVANHTGGSLDEALAVYAIVNAVVTNLPDVTAVQFLVDGREIDTLVGHLDMRRPLSRSLAWVRQGR